MPPRNSLISALAEAVTDGDYVDWPAAEARLTTSQDFDVASHLKALSTLTDRSATRPRGVSANPRLTPLLEIVRVVAIVVSVIGAVGEILAVRSGGSREAVLLLVVVAFAGAAVFLDLGGNDRRARALGACYWSVAAAYSASGAIWLSVQYGGRLFATAAALRPEAFLAACLWQFTREFPILSRFSVLDRLCTVAVRTSLAFAVVLFAANLVSAVAPALPLAGYAEPFLRFTPRWGPWFWTLVLGSALCAVLTMAGRARAAANTQERNRVRLFLYAMAVSFTPIAIEVIAEALFADYQRVVQTRWRWLVGWIILPPQIALPIFTAYAVLVDNVLDVKVVIQRGLRHLLARSLMTWGAAAPIVLLLVYAFRHRHQPMAVALDSTTAYALLGLSAAGIAVLSFQSRLVAMLDRWALPGADEPSSMLARMSSRMKETRTPLEVASVLAKAIEGALQAPADIYLVHDGALVTVDRKGAPLPRESLIPTLLVGSAEPCSVVPHEPHSYYFLLHRADREWIAAQRYCLIVPLLSGRSRTTLLAFVALRTRRNALSFSQENLRFLRAAAAAANLACDVLHLEAQPSADATPEPEELAMQCSRCGRVEVWALRQQPCACGGEWESAAVPKVLARRFTVVRRLGAGGMGVVYAAMDTTLGRDVALKTLPRLAGAAAARLLIEARTMARLSYPAIAVLYGTEVWRDTPVLVMEYLAGGTLATRVRHGPLGVGEAVRIATALAFTLEHVHDAGMYHGDIKPSNIGFTADGTPKFLDFGLSTTISDSQATNAADSGAPSDEQRGIAGTFAYMSPEVRDGAAAGPALDVWALSVVLCEMLLGRHPFADARSDKEIARGVTGAIAALRAAGNPELCQFLAGALATDPHRAPGTARDFVSGLAALS